MIADRSYHNFRQLTEEWARQLEALRQGFEEWGRQVERMRRGIADSAALLRAPVESLRPGAFLGDIVLIASPDLPKSEREAAARRLAQKWFTCGALFHSNRWNILRDHFYARMREEEQGEKTTWDHLVLPSIFLACNHHEFSGQPVRDLFSWLRRRIGREIEQDLRHGQTLDATQEEPWPESEEALRLEVEYRNELLDLWPFPEDLTLADCELELVLADHGEMKAIAERQGISYPAARQRRSRLIKRLRGWMSQIT